MEFLLSSEVQDVTTYGFSSLSIFYIKKENLSSWKKVNMLASIEEYQNMPSMENFENWSWMFSAKKNL